jgi:hypothetical protein
VHKTSFFPSSGRRATRAARSIRAARFISTALVMSCALSVGAAGVASAEPTVTIPVLLPTPVPEGFSLVSANNENLRRQQSSREMSTYVVYSSTTSPLFSTQPFDFAAPREMITGQPAAGGLADDIVQENKRNKKKDKVGKSPAYVDISGTGGSILWVSGGVALRVSLVGSNVNAKTLKAAALTVKATKSPQQPFKLTKAPIGEMRFAGKMGDMLGESSWDATYQSGNSQTIGISGAEADPLYVEIIFMQLGALVGDVVTQTTVRGFPGINIAGNQMWAEGPRSLMSVQSDGNVSNAVLDTFVASLQPVDAATWAAAPALAAENQKTLDSASRSAATGVVGGGVASQPVLAAGMSGTSPWTVKQEASAKADTKCYSFEIAETVNRVCAGPELATNGVVWKATVAGDRRTIVGLANEKVTTVVLRDKAGTEIGRTNVVPMTSGTQRVFVFPVGVAGTLTPVAAGEAILVGLDAAGAEVGPGQPVSDRVA